MFPQIGPTTSLNLAAHCLTITPSHSLQRALALGVRWIVQRPLYSHKLTSFDRAPSYTHRGSVSTETTHKVNLPENLFRQRILYGKWCKIPSRHQKGSGNSVQVWHLESKDFLCNARRAFGAVGAWRRDPPPRNPADPWLQRNAHRRGGR